MEALSWLQCKLQDNPSVEDAKAFIENYNDELMGIDDGRGSIVVPLHYAIMCRASDEPPPPLLLLSGVLSDDTDDVEAVSSLDDEDFLLVIAVK
eukprot:scaffold3107_cov77-Skeletonema_dohrnii-CCMP3373.AAC.10